MPWKKGDYSILLYAGLIIVFLLLAVIGGYIIIGVTGNHDDTDNYRYVTGGCSVSYFNDSMQLINSPDPLYLNNGNFSSIANFSTSDCNIAYLQWLTMAFVDYNLTPIYYDSNLEKSHMIAFQSQGSHNVSLHLTGLQNGTHDVLFLNVLDPYYNQTDDLFSWDISGGLSGRFELLGNASAPNVQFNAGPLKQFVTFNKNFDNNLSGGPWLTEYPFHFDGSTTGINFIDATPGEDIGYYIDVNNGVNVMGYGSELNDRFAIMQLLDYEQMPLRHDTPGDVYFGALNPGQSLALHADIIAPTTPGKHILSIVYVIKPYEELSYADSPCCNLLKIIINVAP